FSHQEQALSIRTGSRESRGPLCQARPPREEAAIPPLVDLAHRRRRSPERHHLWAAHPWLEGRGNYPGPESSCGYGCARRGRLRTDRRKGQGVRAEASDEEGLDLA